jgi:hypothetical protein
MLVDAKATHPNIAALGITVRLLTERLKPINNLTQCIPVPHENYRDKHILRMKNGCVWIPNSSILPEKRL